MHPPPARRITILACILALALLALSIHHCLNQFTQTDILAKTPDAPGAGLAGADMRLYLKVGRQYQTSGQLYARPARDGETIASMYAPLTPVFKFPPAFQLQLLPIVNSQNPERFINPLRTVMIVGYFLACLALTLHIGAIMRRQNQPNFRILLFATLAAIAATSSDGLQTGVLITNYEIPIFVFMTASFFLYHKHPRLTATIIGYLASAKLYPAFMASLLLTRRDGKALIIFGLSVLFFSAIAWLVFGSKENLFYFGHVLPALLSEKVAPMLYNMSFGGAMFKFSQNLEFAQGAFHAYRLLFLGLTCFLLARYHKKHTKSSIEVFALLMTLMLICLPNYWTNYLIMLFPAFCVAIYRVVTCPGPATIVILLICMACMAIDNNAWLALWAPAWLNDNTVSDEVGTRIIEASTQQDTTKVILLFARHYPWTVFLYLLEQIKFIVPAILWLFTARQIISPALRHD